MNKEVEPQMYCPKCGEQNPDNSSFCSKCGAALTQTASVSQRPLETARTSGLAIASLVLGLVGFLINPLSILAIIFGAVAMSQTGRNHNLKGRGMAIAGLVLGIIVAAFWIIIVIVAGSVFWWAF
jgi:uncharacterized membrane protein YvbJ